MHNAVIIAPKAADRWVLPSSFVRAENASTNSAGWVTSGRPVTPDSSFGHAKEIRDKLAKIRSWLVFFCLAGLGAADSGGSSAYDVDSRGDLLKTWMEGVGAKGGRRIDLDNPKWT